MADSLSKGARIATSLRVKQTHGREIAMNLCKSRLLESAAVEHRADLRRKARTSASGNHLFHADKALAGNPLLNKGVDGALTTRRDEVVFNQMRLGCVTFSSGYRWRPHFPPSCALCSEPDGPGHALLRCSKLCAGRRQLFGRVLRERAERAQRKIEDDIKNGRPPRPRKVNHQFNSALLTEHPDAVLEFVRNSPVWLDRICNPLHSAQPAAAATGVRGTTARLDVPAHPC